VKIVCKTIRTKRELKKEVVAPAGLQPLTCYTKTLKSGNFKALKKEGVVIHHPFKIENFSSICFGFC